MRKIRESQRTGGAQTQPDVEEATSDASSDANEQPAAGTSAVCGSSCAGHNLSRNERHAIWKASQPFLKRAREFQRRRNKEYFPVCCQQDCDTFKESEYQDMSNLDMGTIKDVTCEHCGALRFSREKSKICCQNGKVKLDPLPQPPDGIYKYYGVDRKSRKFKERIREYNSVHGMASLGLDNEILGSPDSNTFLGNLRIRGGMYHSIGPVQALPGHRPAYAQIYFHDTDYQTNIRKGGYTGNRKLDEEIVHDLTCALNDVNPYVNVFRSAAELIQGSDNGEKANIVLVNDKTRIPEGAHQRSYNSPVASEVAAIVFGDPERELKDRPVVISYKNSGCLQKISTMHRSYDPLLYVLLFPHGTDG